MRRCKCGRDIGRYARDLFLEIQVALWSAVIVLSVCALMIGPGCTASQLAALEDGLVSLRDCSVYSSLGCASQAMAGCQTPDGSGGTGWDQYGDCLAEKSLSCGSAALARCSYRAVAAAAGGPVVFGGTGCNDDEGRSALLSCVSEVVIENEAEAVNAVANCTRRVCLNMED
jgi:hypothetical protein